MLIPLLGWVMWRGQANQHQGKVTGQEWSRFPDHCPQSKCRAWGGRPLSSVLWTRVKLFTIIGRTVGGWSQSSGRPEVKEPQRNRGHMLMTAWSFLANRGWGRSRVASAVSAELCVTGGAGLRSLQTFQAGRSHRPSGSSAFCLILAWGSSPWAPTFP